MLKFLSGEMQRALSNVNQNRIYELRLRAGKPLYLNYGGAYRLMSAHGITDYPDQAYIVSQEEIEDTLFRAGNFSVYSVEEQIKQGFLTTERGVRIGIAGRFVFDKGQPMTVRDVTSLCIRLPHDVKGAGELLYRTCCDGKRCRNLLLLSLPGRGKTTALREVCRLISERLHSNLLLCDERGELSFGRVGETCDVLSFADKKLAFEVGIRTMCPDIIATDELSVEDMPAIKRALSSGVTVLATAHVADRKKGEQLFGDLFERYVFLSKEEVGRVEKIFDANWKEISC